jgi:biotin carboxyl carrier protein
VTEEVPNPAAALAEVLDAVRGTGIAELEVEWHDLHVRVTREPTAGPVLRAGDGPVTLPDPEVFVRSTYVGVFHPDPSLPAPGSWISAGARIGEVETLGIRNSITTPIGGTLVDLLVTDLAPVEYGQRLAMILPAEAPGA